MTETQAIHDASTQREIPLAKMLFPSQLERNFTFEEVKALRIVGDSLGEIRRLEKALLAGKIDRPTFLSEIKTWEKVLYGRPMAKEVYDRGIKAIKFYEAMYSESK